MFGEVVREVELVEDETVVAIFCDFEDYFGWQVQKAWPCRGCHPKFGSNFSL